MIFLTKLKSGSVALNFIFFGYLFLVFKTDASSTCDSTTMNFFKEIERYIKINDFPIKGEITISKQYININPIKTLDKTNKILTATIASYFRTKFPSKSVVFSIAPYNKNSNTIKVYISSVGR